MFTNIRFLSKGIFVKAAALSTYDYMKSLNLNNINVECRLQRFFLKIWIFDHNYNGHRGMVISGVNSLLYLIK